VTFRLLHVPICESMLFKQTSTGQWVDSYLPVSSVKSRSLMAVFRMTLKERSTRLYGSKGKMNELRSRVKRSKG
jgi:hypothetical protein